MKFLKSESQLDRVLFKLREYLAACCGDERSSEETCPKGYSAVLLRSSLFYLSLFLLIFIPLYPKFPLINIPGTFVAVRFEDLLIALAVALWAAYIWLKKDLTFFLKDNIGRSFKLFLTIGLISLFSGIFLTHTTIWHLGLLHLLRRAEFMLLLPVFATLFNTKKRFLIALTVLLVSLVVVNIYALGQLYLDWPVVSTTNSEFAKGQILRLTPGARVNSTFAGHYDLAVFLNIALILLTAAFFAIGKLFKLPILVIGFVSFVILVMTAARVSFVAAFIGIIVVLFFIKKKKYLLLIFAFLMLAVVYPSNLRDRFVSTITINLFNLGKRYEGRNLSQQLENKLNIPTLYYRMASRSASQSAFASPSAGIPVDIAPGEPIDETELAVYRSFQIRLNIEWPKAINAFLKNPFLGLGYSSLGIASDNDFLRSLGEAGLLGSLAFALVIIAVWKRIYKGMKSEQDRLIKYFSSGSLALIIVFLANGTFIDVFEASKVVSLFWMILGINIGLLKD